MKFESPQNRKNVLPRCENHHIPDRLRQSPLKQFYHSCFKYTHMYWIYIRGALCIYQFDDDDEVGGDPTALKIESSRWPHSRASWWLFRPPVLSNRAKRISHINTPMMQHIQKHRLEALCPLKKKEKKKG